MSVTTPNADPFVVLYGISPEQYVGISDALAEYPNRHTYNRGTLEMRALLYGVAPESYTALLEALGDYSLRHTFYKGTLEMMSPRKDHDWIKSLIGRMIESMALQFDISIQSIGSTTLRAGDDDQSLQPDEAYYVQNEPQVRGRSDYVPGVDPPPDLVLEVEVTSSCVRRMPVFATIGVPEVWRHDVKQLHFMLLDEQGQYRVSPTSKAFPFLRPEDITSVLAQRASLRENDLIRLFLKQAAQRRNST